KLAIAAGRSSDGSPRGKPHTARNCCSNWLVTQASKVKCPELCGRGASSLITSSPESSMNISTASKPTTSNFLVIADASSIACLTVCGATSAGDVVTSRIWRRCTFSEGGKHTILPSAPRAQITESSLTNGTN